MTYPYREYKPEKYYGSRVQEAGEAEEELEQIAKEFTEEILDGLREAGEAGDIDFVKLINAVSDWTVSQIQCEVRNCVHETLRKTHRKHCQCKYCFYLKNRPPAMA